MPPLELVSLVEWKTGGNDDNDLKAYKADGWGVGTEAAGSRGEILLLRYARTFTPTGTAEQKKSVCG